MAETAPENGEQEGVVYEVETILRYRKHHDGQEWFYVKWVGYSVEEATWEPLSHMNESCRELVAKARALFAWRKPSPQPPAQEAQAPTVFEPAPVQTDGDTSSSFAARVEEEEDDAEGDGVMEVEAAPDSGGDEEPRRQTELQLRPRSSSLQQSHSTIDEGIIVDDGDDSEEDGEEAGGEESPEELEAHRPAAVLRSRTSSELAAGGVGGSAAPPAKRPKLQAPPFAPGGSPGDVMGTSSKGATPNGVPRQAPPTPKAAVTQPDDGKLGDLEDPEPIAPATKRPVAREMKCICGVSEKVSAASRDKLVVCRICNSGLHPKCVEGAISGPAPTDFVCPPCRIERVDEFHPPVGSGLLRHSYASSSQTFTLSFSCQPALWKKQAWAVHLRAVSLSNADLSGPAWPHRVQGKINGRQCVAIDPPKHLHVRREQCYNLTPLLKPGMNQLEVKFTPKPAAERKPGEEDESYCVGVVLTRPRSVASIIARIRTRSTETVSSGQQRVRRLIAQVARKERNEEDCTVTGNFGRMLKPLCPVSLCPIEESAIGRHCNHIQVFDLQAYIAVNQRMRSLDKRWTCPVCSLALRPDDVVLDPFAQGILDTLRGDEDLVEAVVFNENCTWATISAVKDEKERGAGGGAAGEEQASGDGSGKAGAELIDLSDSE